MSSPGLSEWLSRHDVSLLLSTYQAGRLIAVGRNPDGGVSVFQRSLERCMGLWASADAEEFWVATAWQLWRFANALTPGTSHDNFDRVYVPRTGHTTGDLDIHDVALDGSGAPVFVNTKFNCLAQLSHRHSFTPIWKPDFITDITPEDRCHLNGLALRDGVPAYATSVSATNVADGWREHRAAGGVVFDIAGGTTIGHGWSMPHSPRWHRNRLWLLNAGEGEFGYVDPDTGRFAALTFLPGFARGLAFAGNYAIVGLSAERREFAFDGLALADELSRRNQQALCGIVIIDLATGDIAEWIRIEGAVRELYDVAVLYGASRPMVLGFLTDEIKRLLSIDSGA